MTREEINHGLRLLKKLFILAALLFLLDRGIGLLLQYQYKKNPPPDVQAFNHVIKSPTEDIFIFGSSKAAHGYVSNTFSDTLGLSCFNAGREQTNILYSDVVLNEMLKRHSPKLVILDINAKETVSNSMEASKLILANLMMPYIGSDTAIQKLGKKLFPKEVVTAELSMLQRFNSQILPLIVGSISKKKNTRVSQNGYIPAHGSKVMGDLPSFEDRGERYDSTAKNYFENFITTLQEKNIKLYVIQSPYYVQKFTTSHSLTELKAIMQKHNVEFLDYSFDTSFFKKEYFYDNVHLNDKGAHAFSEKVASDIKSDLEKNDPALLNKIQTVER
jgi:hypothetical protein